MIPETDLVKHNFSKHAESYHQVARCQKHTAKKLMQMITCRMKDHNVNTTFTDLGSGTGFLTTEIFDTYPNANVNALDIAPQMNKIAMNRPELKKHLTANKLLFLEGDMNALIPTLKTNYIVSSLSLQWMRDLRTTLKLISAQLPEDGVFAFSILTNHTFRELRASFEHFNAQLPGPRLLARDELNIMIADEFTIETRFYEKWTETHDSPLAFLRQLHETGAINATGKPIPVDLMRKIIQYYGDNFSRDDGKISVIYSIAYFICTKKKTFGV